MVVHWSQGENDIVADAAVEVKTCAMEIRTREQQQAKRCVWESEIEKVTKEIINVVEAKEMNKRSKTKINQNRYIFFSYAFLKGV